MSRPIRIDFEGNEGDAVKAFDRVGDASRKMSKEVDVSTTAHTRLGEKVGGNEQAFMGTADLLDGLGGAFGLPTEGATNMARAFGDLSGGFEIVSGIIPGVSSLMPKLASAMTFVSAHPLMVGILVGGAIIAGLIILEKKFGLVSSAVGALGDAFQWAWENAIKPALNFMIGGIELYVRAMAMPFTLLNKIPGVGSLIPDGLANIRLPRLAVGGTVLETGLAVVHRGEEVRPASTTSNYGGESVNVTVYIAGSVVSENEIVDTIHAGLLRKQNRGAKLGFRAA